MAQVCFYLHLHQPYRLKKTINIFDVGDATGDYFRTQNSNENKHIFQKVVHKSYLPMLGLLKELLEEQAKFRCALSISGVFLEQAQAYAPELLELLKELVATGKVELLAETYYHSLASLYSQTEFLEQIKLHEQALDHFFSIKPTVFRNTELIYSNEVAEQVAQMGYTGMLTEAVDRYLGGRPREQVYKSYTKQELPLLLKHAQLSDDIAFRFSDKNWSWYPLTAEQYLEWVELQGSGDERYVNLFMDFETFGEHQWEDTGIFAFFRAFVVQFLRNDWNTFVTPSDVFSQYEDVQAMHKLPVYDVPEPISWADIDRDTTAWTENELQQDTLRIIYDLEPQVKASNSRELLRKWRSLQISDHFYYMCTKWSADGDVHAYFSPYDSPFEAYRSYCIALADLQEHLL